MEKLRPRFANGIRDPVAGLWSPASVRVRALITVFYWSGLRLAEALALELPDIDLGAREGPTPEILDTTR